MTKATLKKNIHRAIDNIDDDVFLEALYVLLNRISYNGPDSTDEDLRIVEERRAAFLSGREKMISLKELNKRLKKKFPSLK